MEEQLIDLGKLKDLSRHNHSFIKEILEVFLINTPKDLALLEENFASGDWQMVRYYSHKLKSSSHTIGFVGGHKLFNQIEDIIKDESDTAAIGPLLSDASELLGRALIGVKIELANLV